MISRCLLHGFTGSSKSWEFLADPTALAPTLVGHAGARDEALAVDGFEAEVERLAALLPSTSAVHAVGYSLGARLALGLALRHPERVARLTLLSGHPGLESDAERAARRASDAAWCELLLREGLAAFVDAWQAQPLWASQATLAPRLLAHKRRERLSHNAEGLCRSLRLTGLAEMPNYRERLRELGMPVTLVAGELDPKFCDLARDMAGRLRHVQLEIVPGAGHDLLLERPEFVSELIQRGDRP